MPYSIDVKNTGANPLTNLQVVGFARPPRLRRARRRSRLRSRRRPGFDLPVPATVRRQQRLHRHRVGVRTRGRSCSADPDRWASGRDARSSSGCVSPTANAAAIPTAPQTNRVTARTSSRAGGVTVASGESAASVRLRLPRVDVTKMLTGVTQLGDEPVFDISYAIVRAEHQRGCRPERAGDRQSGGDVCAGRAGDLHRVRAVDRERERVAHPGDGVVQRHHRDGDAGRIRHDDAWHREPDRDSRSASGTTSAASIPVGIDLNNSAIATTSVTSGGVVITRDESTDVTESGAPPRADDEPTPTTVRLVPRARLTVEKIANMLVAEIGDAVQYAVRVRNLGGPTLPEVSVTDRLPLGFRYIAGSARLAVSGAAQPLPDPAGGAGPVLTFAIPSQAADRRSDDHLPGAHRSRRAAGRRHQSRGRRERRRAVEHRAGARPRLRRRLHDRRLRRRQRSSRIATATVSRMPANPACRTSTLNFEEGTSLVSDLEGKYSYCGLTPTTHVLQVDRTTLPAGARLTTSSNRNAGDAGSLFVDLKFGEVHRADFIVDAGANPDVLEEIGVRRSARRSLGAVVRRAGAAGDHRWPAGDRERRRLAHGCGRCADGSRRRARRPADSNRSGRRAASTRRTRMHRSRCRLTLGHGAVIAAPHAGRDAAVHGAPADAGGRSA